MTQSATIQPASRCQSPPAPSTPPPPVLTSNRAYGQRRLLAAVRRQRRLLCRANGCWHVRTRDTNNGNKGGAMRLKGKIAVVIGAGQSSGETLGNGRATVLRFAQEGAAVFAVDRDRASAEETAAMVRAEGGVCETAEADVTRESDLKAAIQHA